MLVPSSKLVKYNIPLDQYFANRNERNSFFLEPSYSARLVGGIFCAIGNDIAGWELEQYNGVNWNIVDPNSNYSLIITKAGLDALYNVMHGGLKLVFSGIKIIDAVVSNPVLPVIAWTDEEFLRAGNLQFSVGTIGSPNSTDASGNPLLSQILSWRFNTAIGGLQYMLTLPPDGFGSVSDIGAERWNIGTIGLYVKDPTLDVTDVLFGVASLITPVEKISTTVDNMGNSLKFYLNTVLNNLGYVSDLSVMEEGEQNIPEVSNQSLLTYPSDVTQRPYNCYLVDNMYGTGIPALALKRATSATVHNSNWTSADWAFLQPSDNFINVTADAFNVGVTDYSFVYWNSDSELYCLAEGTVDKQAIGIRIGNSVVFSGEIINSSTSYQYSMSLNNAGTGYAINDELLILATATLTLKITVTNVNGSGAITGFAFIGPTVGNLNIPVEASIISAIYDPRAQFPRYGIGAKFQVTAVATPSTIWNFDSSWLNKPVYCDVGLNAGKPTIAQTDSFLGWCMSTNSIRLALDLRNEATDVSYGTTRYATNAEVKESYSNLDAREQTCLTPKTAQANFLQSSLPTNPTQPGSSLANPVQVMSYTRFDKMILGKGTISPYDDPAVNPDVTDSSVSFYGKAFRAWYADIAEFYESDKFYEAGTLICFGKGQKEISIATTECDGIISTNPGYQLGERKNDDYLPVALVGRVPVLFDGYCMPKFGDKIYLSQYKPGHASTIENGKCLGKIIAKNFGTSTLLECVVRVDF